MNFLTVKSWVLAISLLAGSMSAMAAPVISGDLDASSNVEQYEFGSTGVATSFTDYLAVSFLGDRDIFAVLGGTSSGAIDFSAFNLVSFDKLTTLATGDLNNLKLHIASADFEGTSSAGTYWLYVAGTSTGTATYSGSLSAISPVPEAETYSMMLAGLGLMGFVARRRKV